MSSKKPEETAESLLLELRQLRSMYWQLQDRVFQNCKVNPERRMFVPVSILKRCYEFGCLRKIEVSIGSYHEYRQKRVLCKECLESLVIPF